MQVYATVPARGFSTLRACTSEKKVETCKYKLGYSEEYAIRLDRESCFALSVCYPPAILGILAISISRVIIE